MLADTGGTDVELIGQQGMARAGQGRAGLGNALDGGDIGRDEPLSVSPVVSRRACVSCSVCWSSALRPMQQVHRTTLQRTHMQVDGGRSIAADEWMTGPAAGLGAAWKPPRLSGCVYRTFLDPVCLAFTRYAVWYEETQERG